MTRVKSTQAPERSESATPPASISPRVGSPARRGRQLAAPGARAAGAPPPRVAVRRNWALSPAHPERRAGTGPGVPRLRARPCWPAAREACSEAAPGCRRVPAPAGRARPSPRPARTSASTLLPTWPSSRQSFWSLPAPELRVTPAPAPGLRGSPHFVEAPSWGPPFMGGPVRNHRSVRCPLPSDTRPTLRDVAHPPEHQSLTPVQPTGNFPCGSHAPLLGPCDPAASPLPSTHPHPQGCKAPGPPESRVSGWEGGGGQEEVTEWGAARSPGQSSEGEAPHPLMLVTGVYTFQRGGKHLNPVAAGVSQNLARGGDLGSYVRIEEQTSLSK